MDDVIDVRGTEATVSNLEKPRMSPWGHLEFDGAPAYGNEKNGHITVRIILGQQKFKVLDLLIKDIIASRERRKEEKIHWFLNEIEQRFGVNFPERYKLLKTLMKTPADLIYLLSNAISGYKNPKGILENLFLSPRTAKRRNKIDKWIDENCGKCREAKEFCQRGSSYNGRPYKLTKKELDGNYCSALQGKGT